MSLPAHPDAARPTGSAGPSGSGNPTGSTNPPDAVTDGASEDVPAPDGTQEPAGSSGSTPAADDPGLRDIWTGFSDPRRASCLSWLAFLVTWLITRFITIHGKDTGGGAAITIAGHHVHHYLFGIILLGIVSAIALFVKPERGWELLGIGYGIALALILDEYALLLNLSDVYWKHQGQLSVDIVLVFIAAGGVYITAIAWVNESVRRGRKRARTYRPRRRR